MILLIRLAIGSCALDDAGGGVLELGGGVGLGVGVGLGACVGAGDVPRAALVPATAADVDVPPGWVTSTGCATTGF